MKDNFSRFALVLAGLDFSESELKRLLAEVRSMPTSEVMRRVVALAGTSASLGLDRPLSEPMSEVHGRQLRDATVGERVERLLRFEAKLPTAVACDELAKMLVEAGALRKEEIPPLSKKALRVWVDRVVKKVPAKEVLRFATIARNQHVHSPQADWSLGKRPE